MDKQEMRLRIIASSFIVQLSPILSFTPTPYHKSWTLKYASIYGLLTTKCKKKETNND